MTGDNQKSNRPDDSGLGSEEIDFDPSELDLQRFEQTLAEQIAQFEGDSDDSDLTDLLNSVKKQDDSADEVWDDDPAERLKRVEAVFFLSRKPLTLRKISELARLEDATQARTMIGQLNQKYDRLGQAFHIKKVAGGFQMLTRPQFSPWIERMEHIPRPLRMSNPAMETLTIVAYRQPIIKAEIEAIRGLASGEMLRQLLELNLIKISGRSPKLGRPFLYSTTKEFLTCFGLNGLQDLPRSKQLLGTGLPNWGIFDNNLDDQKHGSSTPQKEETLKETEL